MDTKIFNANPVVYMSRKSARKSRFETGQSLWLDGDEDEDRSSSTDVEPIDQDEIFDLIRSISDPEHPNSLEELRVVSAEQIEIGDNLIAVEFTPTVPHCGMSTLIGKMKLFRFHADACDSPLLSCPGLCIRVRLLRSLPPRFKVDIRVKPGSHQSELAGALPRLYNMHTWVKLVPISLVNKQLNDKERVAAALENSTLLETLEKCLLTAEMLDGV
ncbi:FAM96B protein [Chiua virens]|nr:FAM96B protein [Chiua virens]